jgi:hypothetical protein
MGRSIKIKGNDSEKNKKEVEIIFLIKSFYKSSQHITSIIKLDTVYLSKGRKP